MMTTPEIEPLLLKLMSSIILFRGLEREELAELLRGATKVVFKDGDIVFEEGFPGHSLYVVLQGKFEVFKKIEGSEAHVAVVSSGEHFGEIALITDQLRTASVRALEESVVLRLTKASIFGNPRMAVYLLKNMAGLMAAHLSEMNNEVLLLDASRLLMADGDESGEDEYAEDESDLDESRPRTRVRHSR